MLSVTLPNFQSVCLSVALRYTIMQSCWAQEPQMRPGFFAVREKLEALLFTLDADTSLNVRVDDMRYDVPDVVRDAPGEKC